MANSVLQPEAVRRHLERALASSGFVRSERLSRFLRFVVEHHLEGRDEALKESVIALEVFGQQDYDPRQDSIVRTEAGRLRARLADYYVGPGSADLVIFDLPKGGYVPVFRCIDAVPAPVPVPGRPPARRHWLLPVAGVCALLLSGVTWWWITAKSAPITIAVLPLQNLNQDPATDYLSDGLTDEIIRNLSIIEGLAVRSQTSSFVFKRQPRNLHDVGKQLDADYILEGSVLRSGNQLRIDTQLVRVRDDVTVWSGKYSREMTDILNIQEVISQGIVNSLRLKLGRGRRRYETSPEAYDVYLRARALDNQRTLPGPEQLALYQEVVAKDPSFAPAYAGIAVAYAFSSGTYNNLDRQEDLLAKMRAAAEKAVQLDPLLAEAYDALGMVYARDGKWDLSERSFRRAIELDVNNSAAYGDYSLYLLLVLGRTQDAIKELKIGEKADPLSSKLHYFLAYGLMAANRYEEAAAQCEKMLPEVPSRNECLGRARFGQGRTAEALQLLPNTGNKGFLGYVYARAGQRDAAEKVATENARNPFNQALAFAGLGDKDRTFEALDRMAAQGPVRIGRLLNIPEFAFLRGDPRVKTLRRKVGLPEN
jgi:TolB-like protein